MGDGEVAAKRELVAKRAAFLELLETADSLEPREFVDALYDN